MVRPAAGNEGRTKGISMLLNISKGKSKDWSLTTRLQLLREGRMLLAFLI
jgi:hypothetical protein